MFRPILISCFCLCSIYCQAQNFYFKYDDSTPVQVDGIKLENAWAGGLNSVQTFALDINNDTQEDILIFEKTTGKIYTFITTTLNGGKFYNYEPKYEALFPLLKDWVQVADFNCDGNKDLFTTGNSGNIRVYQNAIQPSGLLQFRLKTDAIVTEGLSGPTTIHTLGSDLPSVVDVDNDGDLDILAFDFSSGTYVEYHQNLSMETFGNCSSLLFKKNEGCWGNFTEGGSCVSYSYGASCGTATNMRIQHVGSSILGIDIDGDGDKDILAGDNGCDNLIMLRNDGTPSNANITASTDTFPSRANPLFLKTFPAAFYEDVDFDGKKDLLMSPNLQHNEGNMSNMQTSNWFYKNTGTSISPSFQFIQNDFLQEGMIDLGENSYPVLIDADADGDFDLIVGNKGKIQVNGTFYATLTYLENTGTKSQPAFTLITEDYLKFSTLGYTNIKAQFIDLNKDKLVDLVFSATEAGGVAHLNYIINKSAGSFQFNISERSKINFTLNDYDTPYLVDYDKDGILDLLLGKSAGRLELFKNLGNNLAPNFSLITNKLGGIDNSITERNAYPYLADLNKDGKSELLLADESGALRIFDNAGYNLTGDFNNTPNFLLNEIENSFIAPNFGHEVFPASADLNDDGFPELILGSYTGGLVYLKNDVIVSGINEESPQKAFKIYPNPSDGNFIIESFRDSFIEVYNILGQKVFMVSVKSDAKSLVNFSGLKKGVYILKLKTDRASQYFYEKLIIE